MGKVLALNKKKYMQLLIGIKEDGSLEGNGWEEIKEFKALYERWGGDGVKCMIMGNDSGSVYGRMDIDERERVSAKQYFGKRWEEYLKSRVYIDAKYLYRSLDYDELVESRGILQGKLREINGLLQQVKIGVEGFEEMRGFTQLQARLLDDIEKIKVRIVERGERNKDLRGMIATGIEEFYKMAKKRKEDDLFYRNKRRKGEED